MPRWSRNLDWNIGRLVAALKANGLYDNTLILVLSSSTGAQAVTTHRSPAGMDNSIENMGRKNAWVSYTERWAEVSNAPFSRWKAKTTEGGTVVPFIVRLPGQIAARKTSDAMALMRDIAPTLVDFAQASGGKAPLPYTGESLRPLWEGRVDAVYPADHPFVDEYRDEAYVRWGEWKAVLISNFAVNAYDGADAEVIEYKEALERGDMLKADAIRAERPLEWKLYNIAKDRGETHDLASQNPLILARLVVKYEEYRKQRNVPAPRLPTQ